MTRVAAVVVAGLLTATAAGCADHAGETVHADGQGTLSLSSATGGVSIVRSDRDAPPDKSWFGYFGTMMACTTTGQPVVVHSVSATGASPADLTLLNRLVAPEQMRQASARERRGYMPTYTWDNPTAYPATQTPSPHAPAGTYSAVQFPWRVTQSCKTARAAQKQLSMGQVPSTAFDELVVRLRTGVAGLDVRHLMVKYTTSDGKKHTLRTDWRMVTCGTSTPADVCTQR